jgi:conjugative relaxase-like TrwC/TraI family protein
MLRITQNSHAGGAKSYYSTGDYYLEGQELAGQWRGEAARRLGLFGEVKQADWEALCDNLHPQTGEQLTARRKTDRTIGYDFNFHVPKSVSLLYAMTRDERLLAAFRDAVDGTMHDIESEMSTRVRKAGKNENRQTGNMVWGEFVHFTSRPVDGLPDPHLHAHCFASNATFDKEEEVWKAGQFRELKRDAPYFEAVFHTRLAHRLSDLGLPIERTKNGWELGGISRSLISKFSRRTTQIEDKAREMGINDVEAKAELGAKTRERKQKELTFSELRDAWRGRMSPEELAALAALEQKLGGEAEPPDENASGRAVEYALGHCFERSSVVPERQVLTAALRQAVGKTTVVEVQRAAAASGMITAERNGRRMVSTREILNEERAIIKFAREGRGQCRPFAKRDHQLTRQWLNDDQQKAVRHILGSRDRVTVLRGSAGVGKTTLMQEAVEAIEQSGTKVFAFAPSAAASRGVLRSEGFEADTVARLLLDENLQQQAAGQLIWVDEAGLLGTKTMRQLFDLAEKIEARVLLTGDRRQHGSVDRGAALRLLEEEAGLKPAEVKEIQRQRGEYKEAVKALSEGRAGEGLRRLDKLGWVREIAEDDRYRQLAADYVTTVTVGKSAIVVSPTHAEASKINGEIRGALRKSGAISREHRTYRVLENAYLTQAERGDAVNYEPGDVLQFEQNAKGFTRGDRLTVEDPLNAPLDRAARFQVFRTKKLELAPGDIVRITHNGKSADGQHKLDNGSLYRIRRFDDAGNIILDNGWLVGKDFGHLTHGYVVTSHASQGRTVDVALIGQSSASYRAASREQFYVSCSRARERVVVYTDDRAALAEAVSQTDERITATELVAGAPSLTAAAQRSRDSELNRERQEREAKARERERT